MSATLVPLSACRNARRICSSVCPFFATFVSSSLSPRGPRLPLLTQLARGSLFGFWVSSTNDGMTIKVILSGRDEILGAIVRALAVQVAGFQVARGMDGKYLKKN